MKEERKKEIVNSLKMCVDTKSQDLKLYFEDLQRIGNDILKNKRIIDLGNFFNVLGNEYRLEILKLLMQKDYCVCELEAILDKSQSSISHHLKLLENAGFIRGIKRGYFTHYELVYEEFENFLKSFKEEFPFLNLFRNSTNFK